MKKLICLFSVVLLGACVSTSESEPVAEGVGNDAANVGAFAFDSSAYLSLLVNNCVSKRETEKKLRFKLSEAELKSSCEIDASSTYATVESLYFIRSAGKNLKSCSEQSAVPPEECVQGKQRSFLEAVLKQLKIDSKTINAGK